MTKMFFATVQNKLHYAVHENTAAEVIYHRVDNEKPFVGMTNFRIKGHLGISGGGLRIGGIANCLRAEFMLFLRSQLLSP